MNKTRKRAKNLCINSFSS